MSNLRFSDWWTGGAGTGGTKVWWTGGLIMAGSWFKQDCRLHG
jgi:hypothetical protein